MTDARWGRTLTTSGEAMSAALGLAKDCGPGEALFRDVPDGGVEVVTLHQGVLTRYLVHASRAVETLETLVPTRRWRSGRALVKVGIALLPLAIAGGIVFRPENSTLWTGLPLALGFLMIFVGASLSLTKANDFKCYLGSLDGWASLPYKLGGWEPRTAAQLAAVTELSEAGEGQAHVRNLAGGRVEVLTRRKRKRFRNLLDGTGSVLEQEAEHMERRAFLGSRLFPLGFTVCVFLVFFSLGNDARLVALGITGAVLILVGNRWVERRREQGVEGPGWFVVQTEVPTD